MQKILRLASPKLAGRHRTRDVAFAFRMGAGFAGDVNRTHPADIVPGMPNAALPPLFYGSFVFDNGDGTYRLPQAADNNASAIPGVTGGFVVRPYPLQPSSASNYGQLDFGNNVAPPPNRVMDILKSGFIMIPVLGAAVPRAQVFIWCAASSGSHVQGGLEFAATGGSTVPLDMRSFFNSSPDANGICEVAFNL